MALKTWVTWLPPRSIEPVPPPGAGVSSHWPAPRFPRLSSLRPPDRFTRQVELPGKDGLAARPDGCACPLLIPALAPLALCRLELAASIAFRLQPPGQQPGCPGGGPVADPGSPPILPSGLHRSPALSAIRRSGTPRPLRASGNALAASVPRAFGNSRSRCLGASPGKGGVCVLLGSSGKWGGAALGKLRAAGLPARFDLARSFPQFPPPPLLLLDRRPGKQIGEPGGRTASPPRLPDDPFTPGPPARACPREATFPGRIDRPMEASPMAAAPDPVSKHGPAGPGKRPPCRAGEENRKIPDKLFVFS